jgi:hypothetical protein
VAPAVVKELAVPAQEQNLVAPRGVRSRRRTPLSMRLAP